MLALLALFQTACGLGVEGLVVRDIAQHPARAAHTLGSTLRVRLVAGAVGWLLAIAMVAAMRPGDASALLMIAVVGAGLVFQSSDVVDLWFQSQSRSRVTVAAKALAYLSVSALKVALILLHAPVWSFAVAASVEMALIAGALAVAYGRSTPRPTRWGWDRALAIELLRESWPLMLSALSVGIYMRIDQVVLRALAGERELGLYSAVLPFSQVWHMVPMTLCASLLPQLSRLSAQAPDEYRRRLQQLFSLMAWTSMAVAGVTALCAPWLVALLLGPRYADSVGILRWHVITNIFVFLGVAQSVSIVSERIPRVMLMKTVLGAIVSLVANLTLVPHWGATGAAWSAILSQAFSAVLSNAVVAPRTFYMQLKAFRPGRVSSG